MSAVSTIMILTEDGCVLEFQVREVVESTNLVSLTTSRNGATHRGYIDFGGIFALRCVPGGSHLHILRKFLQPPVSKAWC